MPFDGVESPCRYLEKFDQVIDLIENPKKWGKRTYINRSGQYCLIGAARGWGREIDRADHPQNHRRDGGSEILQHRVVQRSSGNAAP
jgi:hypothetical protein